MQATTQNTSTKTGTFSMSDCITRCLDCLRSCEETAAHCLKKGGAHAKAEHIMLLQSCADMCRTSASFMTRGSSHHNITCGACAAICEACAVSCEAMGNDDDMKRCAEVCRRCAASCGSMSTEH